MRWPRFTTLQLLLVAALCALVVGLATTSWRASGYTQVTAVRFSPSGKYLAAHYLTGSVRVWNVEGSRPRLIREMPAAGLWAYDSTEPLCFVNDRTLLDIQSPPNSPRANEAVVRTVDIETGLLHEQFSIRSAGNDGLHAAASDTLAIADWQSGTVDCYSFEKRRQTRSIQPAGIPAYGMSLSSDGKTLVLPDQKGLIHVYDVTTGRVRQSESATGVTSAVLSPDGRWLAHVGWPPTNSGLFVCVADLYDPKTPKILDTLLGDPAWVGFTADSTQIAVAGYHAAELYDLRTRKRLGRVVLDDRPVLAWDQFGAGWRSGGLFSHFALSPDGRTLASFNGEEVLLWDMHSGQLHHRIASRSRTLQILIFALGFCAWAIGWGTVARRQRPTVIPYQPPIELRLIWGLMFIGGLVATTVPAALLVVSGPLVWPGMYYALGVGLVLIAGAAGRRTANLPQVAFLQMFNLLACDPVNFLLGMLAQALLLRPHVQQFLSLANRPAVQPAATDRGR